MINQYDIYKILSKSSILVEVFENIAINNPSYCLTVKK